MALLLPVISKYRLIANAFQQIYMCPGDKTHSVIDLTMFLDSETYQKGPTFLDIYLSHERSLSIPKHQDMIFHRIPLGLPEVSPELGKIIVGKNQTVYIKLHGEGPLNIRTSGLEEMNPAVLQGGIINQTVTTGEGIYEIFKLDNPLATFSSGTLTVCNTDTKEKDVVYVWVTQNEEVKTLDQEDQLDARVQRLHLDPGESVLVENLTLLPNERIYVSSKRKDTVFSYNGMVINANG